MPDNLPEQLHQRPGTAVGPVAEVPYPVDNEEGLTAADILLPRMKFVQKMSGVLDNVEGISYGDAYVFIGKEDREPAVIAKAGAKGDLGEPIRFYTLGDPRKAWSWTRPDKSLGRGPKYPNLGWVIDHNPMKVNRTYQYLLALPAYPTLPVGFLMYGAWGGDAAKFINVQRILARNAGQDPDQVAFKLQSYKAVNTKSGSEQPFIKAIVGLDKVSAKDRKADLELIERHQALAGASNVTLTDEDYEPKYADAESTADDVPSVD